MIAPARFAETDDPDTDLMLLVRDGDETAFVELFAKYRRNLIAVISHMMGDELDSEDLAQQVFLKVYRARKTYIPSAKFTTWLFTITRNTVFNARRALSRRPDLRLTSQISDGDWLAGIGPMTSMDSLDRVIQSELRQSVSDAIGGLTDRQQQAIRLFYMNGHSYEDAAERMQTTVPSIKSLLHRGRASLQQTLKST